ncbi:MAG: hypothetical protein IKW67_01490, partial [Alphaproteobacteria bacterium]|nr:hypothetical protein [Alphaproteobacteria bacterium]
MPFITKTTWQTSSSLPENQRYIRVLIDRSRASDSHIKNLIDVAQQDGYFVSANKTTDGEYFIALSRKNIFGAWDNAQNNWIRNIGQGTKAGNALLGNALATKLGKAIPGGTYKGSFYFVTINNYKQCRTGLKFHVSVDPKDLEKAAYIIDTKSRNSEIIYAWKVYADPTKPNWSDQIGKEFTIYLDERGYNKNSIRRFLDGLESDLNSNGIKTNDFGENIRTGDKRVPGSSYISYRYDHIDDSGNIMSNYRESYDFVAPNNGDIVQQAYKQ